MSQDEHSADEPNKAPSDWSAYQEEVAGFFRGLGLSASTNVRIEGARGSHDIDVLVKFNSAGISVTWVVECKAWNRAIPKERVLLLERLVQDVGADRGLIVAELGFQAGAIRSSRHSNITLTSLADLRANTEDERAHAELASFAIRINALNEERRRLWEWAPPNSKDGPIPVDRMVEFAGGIFELHSLVLPRIATNQFPIVFGYHERVVAQDVATLRSVLVRILASVTEEADALWTLVRAEADHAAELLRVLSSRLTELVAAGRGLDRADKVSGGEFVASMRAVSDAAAAVVDVGPPDVRVEVRTLMRWLIDEVYMQAAEGRLDWDEEQPRLGAFIAAAEVALARASDAGPCSQPC